jgi:Ca2+-binding EF-hand superfamily protein
MLNQGEFQKGLATLVTLNQSTIEKMFNLMDTNNTGMITYE